MFQLAGYGWSTKLVGWGRPGPGSKREMLGYYPRKLKGGKGAISAQQRRNQTIDVWNVPGVYALHKGDALVYVGQATQIGARLLAHYQLDHLAGRWDTFSWFSPVELQIKYRKVSLPSVMPKKLPVCKLHEFLDEMEALCILVGRPFENKQEADLGVYWLNQIPSVYAEPHPDELIRNLTAQVRELTSKIEQIKG